MPRLLSDHSYTVVAASQADERVTAADELGCNLKRLVIARAIGGSDCAVTLKDATGSLSVTVLSLAGSTADYADVVEIVEVDCVNVITSDATDTLDDTARGWYITTGDDVVVTVIGQKG